MFKRGQSIYFSRKHENPFKKNRPQITASGQYVVNTMVKVLQDAVNKNPSMDRETAKVSFSFFLFHITQILLSEARLPDLPVHNIPKCHKIYQMDGKLTKWL
jgi:hypothetical protein